MSTQNSLISLIKNEQSLKQLAIDARSNHCLDEAIKSLILKDSFWIRVNGIRDILFPVYVAKKFIESDKPNITKSFEIFYNLRSGVIAIKRDNPLQAHRYEIIEMINKRREFCLTMMKPLFPLSYRNMETI